MFSSKQIETLKNTFAVVGACFLVWYIGRIMGYIAAIIVG